MADEPFVRGGVTLTRLFPASRLLQGVGVSLQFKMLYLAALGLLLLEVGWWGLDRLFHDPAPLNALYGVRGNGPTFTGPNPFLTYGKTALWRLTEPARVVLGPFLAVFSRQSHGWTWVRAFLTAVWAMIVWGTIGGAIARIATARVAGGVRLGLRTALGFALRKLTPLVGGPLTPLFGVALFAGGCALFGLLYRLPDPVGPVVAGILLFVPLLAGLVMGTILIGLAAGWPLVHAAVAAEAEDGFDALSRSYAYVFQRPGRYAFYLLVCWVVGVAGIVFVDAFSQTVIHLAEWGLSFTAPADRLAAFFGPEAPTAETPHAVTIHYLWLSLIALLVRGWTYAYFWTSASLIYLLLRRDVDGTDFHEVVLPERLGIPVVPLVEPQSAKPAAVPVVD